MVEPVYHPQVMSACGPLVMDRFRPIGGIRTVRYFILCAQRTEADLSQRSAFRRKSERQ